MTEQFSCLSCEDGAKLSASSSRCSECGRDSTSNAFFAGGEESIAASMDEAFDGIVLEPSKKAAPETRPIWWYVNNGRRIGPVSVGELQEAVSQAAEPLNVLIWNEGFSNWRRYGEVKELTEIDSSPGTSLEQSTIEPNVEAASPEPEFEGANETSNPDDSSLLADLAPIEEDALIPEGQPIDDWTPSAAFSLRAIESHSQAPIEPEAWDEEGDEAGLPPSIDTTEFKRDELFATPAPKSGPSVFVVIGVALLLALGAYVAGQQFWPAQSLHKVASTDSGKAGSNEVAAEGDEASKKEVLVPLPATTIVASPSNRADAGTEPKKKSKRKVKKQRKPKKAPRLEATLTDQELEAGLKRNSASLAPCIEGAVNSKEIPSGRHVMKLAYDILPSGRVSSASLVGPKYLVGGALSRCVESTISSWRFSKTAKGREVRGQDLAFRARSP